MPAESSSTSEMVRLTALVVTALALLRHSAASLAPTPPVPAECMGIYNLAMDTGLPADTWVTSGSCDDTECGVAYEAPCRSGTICCVDIRVSLTNDYGAFSRRRLAQDTGLCNDYCAAGPSAAPSGTSSSAPAPRPVTSGSGSAAPTGNPGASASTGSTTGPRSPPATSSSAPLAGPGGPPSGSSTVSSPEAPAPMGGARSLTCGMPAERRAQRKHARYNCYFQALQGMRSL